MWINPHEPANLVRFTEEILNGKLRFYAVVDLASGFTVHFFQNHLKKQINKINLLIY